MKFKNNNYFTTAAVNSHLPAKNRYRRADEFTICRTAEKQFCSQYFRCNHSNNADGNNVCMFYRVFVKLWHWKNTKTPLNILTKKTTLIITLIFFLSCSKTLNWNHIEIFFFSATHFFCSLDFQRYSRFSVWFLVSWFHLPTWPGWFTSSWCHIFALFRSNTLLIREYVIPCILF